MTEFDRLLDHYIAMWRNPGWRLQANHRIDELEEDDSGAFRGIKAEFKRRTDEIRRQAAEAKQAREVAK